MAVGRPAEGLRRPVPALRQLVRSLEDDVSRLLPRLGLGGLGGREDVGKVDTGEQGGRESCSSPVEPERLPDDVLLLPPVYEMNGESAPGQKRQRNSATAQDSLPAQTRVTGRVTTSNLVLRSCRESDKGFLTSLRCERPKRSARPCLLSSARADAPRDLYPPVGEQFSVDQRCRSMGPYVEERGRREEAGVEERRERSLDLEMERERTIVNSPALSSSKRRQQRLLALQGCYVV